MAGNYIAVLEVLLLRLLLPGNHIMALLVSSCLPYTPVNDEKLICNFAIYVERSHRLIVVVKGDLSAHHLSFTV